MLLAILAWRAQTKMKTIAATGKTCQDSRHVRRATAHCWEIKMDIKQCLEAGSYGVMIPIEEYHALPGISGSKLKLLQESNKHLDNYELFSMGDQAHFALGSCVHEMVLEPHIVSFAPIPNFVPRVLI